MFCLIQERGSAFSSLIWYFKLFFEHFSHVRIWYLIKSSNLDFCTLFSFHHSFWIAFQEHHIRTCCGSVSVIVYEDPDKPTLITYPNLAPNCKHCQFIFFYIVPLVCKLINLNGFFIAFRFSSGTSTRVLAVGSSYNLLWGCVPSAEDLADQIINILNYFG